MTSRQIECFLTAAEKLNFTSASEILFVSQSNMSRNISLLEEELGMQLFKRHNNKVMLTQAGVVMYEAFNQIQKYLHQRIDYARNGENATKGKLVLGFLCYMDLESFFSRKLDSFKEKYPEINVELTALPQKSFEHLLASGEVDIIISHDFNTPKSPQIISVELGEAPIYITCSDKHPLAKKPDLSVYDFTDETFWISENVESPDLIHLIHKICAYYKIENYQIKSSASFDTNLLTVSLGKGLLVTDAFSSFKLPRTFLTLPVDPDKFHINILMSWAKSNFNLAISKFVDNNML